MIEPRIDETGAHAFGRLAPPRDKIEEILAIFGGPEDEGRGQEHRWFDGPFRQLRIVTIVQHQRLGMQRVIADLGLRWKWLHHGLSRCLEETTNPVRINGRISSPVCYNAKLGRSSPLARAHSTALS